MSLPNDSSFAPAIAAPVVAGDASVRDTVFFALRFFARNWLRLVATAWLPLILAASILDVSLDGYLSKLESFQGAPDSKIAGLALAELAAGIFACLFLASVVAVSVVEMVSGRTPRGRWIYFRARQQEWRLYAAYLKFSVGVVTIFAVLGGAAIVDVTLIPLWLFMPLGIAGAYALYVRSAFLFPPLIMAERGPIVRRAWHMTGPDAWRIALIVLLLSLPGAIAEMASEFMLRFAGLDASLPSIATLADYAPAMRHVLPGFVAAVTVWAFFNISLQTIGAISIYRALTDERGRPVG